MAQDTLDLVPPSNFQGESPAMTDYAHLTWEEPVDSITGTAPAGLLGYNIYRDGEVVGSVDVPALEYFDLNLELITYIYHISAVYDLTSYGFPGETGESALAGPVEVTLCCLPELPFIENFTTGMFETNQWTAEGNWQIAGQMGNPAPSAEFDNGPLINNYSNSLTSYWISGTGFNDGDIFLDFDLKLNTTNQSGTEFLYVDVYNGEEWTNKATYDNSQAYDWTRPHLNLTAEAKGEQFKIRFRAEGENSGNIQGWYVDNIEVSRVCAVPFDLTASYPGGFHFCEVLLEWVAPDTTGGITTWLEWDNSFNADAIGLNDGGTFLVASRYTPAQLAQYTETNLTRIRLFPYADGGTIVLKVWTGTNASQLMVSQPVASYAAGQWNEFALNIPVPVTGTTELWFGYSITHDSTVRVAGVDAGPAVTGYGDMISMDGSLWESMGQAYGLDYNWNLAGYLEPANKSRSLDYYNIYREGEYIGSATETAYTDTIEDALGEVFCYNVTAVYEDCESEFSNTDCWWQFEPCDVGVDDIDLNDAKIYPTPASSMITVSCNAINEVIIYDILGNILKDIKVSPDDSNIAVDVRILNNGVYLVKLITSKGESIVRKMVVKH